MYKRQAEPAPALSRPWAGQPVSPDPPAAFLLAQAHPPPDVRDEHLLGDGGKGKQVVIVVFHFVAQDRLSTGCADIEFPAVLQCVLQGVGFVGIFRDTGWERKVPSFDGVVAVINADCLLYTSRCV